MLNFATVVVLLTEVVKDASLKKIQSSEACYKSFRTLKHQLSQESIPFHLDFLRQFILEMDASDVGLRVV